jgi:hypothetical protein
VAIGLKLHVAAFLVELVDNPLHLGGRFEQTFERAAPDELGMIDCF